MGEEKIGVIGCGNMGSAIVRGIINSGKRCSNEILINDLDESKALPLNSIDGVRMCSLDDLVSLSDVIILCVKPQDLLSLAAKIRDNLREDIMIVSVMAGVRLDSLSNRLNIETAMVRAMPNMPAVIGEGVTCIAFNDKVNNKELVFGLFQGIGEVLEVDETDMDVVTAVSGSGPAYFFYIAAALIKAAEENGLKPSQAKELVLQTFFGSAKLLREEGASGPGDLLSRVASKGGTTEAALDVFARNAMDKVISEAVFAAKKKSNELCEE